MDMGSAVASGEVEALKTLALGRTRVGRAVNSAASGKDAVGKAIEGDISGALQSGGDAAANLLASRSRRGGRARPATAGPPTAKTLVEKHNASKAGAAEALEPASGVQAGPREQRRDAKGRFLPKEGGELTPGGPFESRVGETLEGINSDVTHHVRIRTRSGTEVVVDYGSRTPDGRLRLTEAKGSETAGFTPNQRTGFPEIAASGGTVIGTGNPAFPAGLKIPPTKVRVVRPEVLERLERARAAREK
jgi:hypothetical protein